MSEKKIAFLCILPFFIIFFMFQILPFIWIAINSFYVEDVGFGLGNFERVLNSKFYKRSFALSFEISLISSLASLIIALFGSYSIYRLSPSKLSSFFLSFNTMISNFSGVPLAFAFIILLGSQGVINILLRSFFGVDAEINIYSTFGINLIYIYFQIPLAMLQLFPAFKVLDEKVQEANAILGAKKSYYWLRVGVPLLLPAILGVFVILFANAMGAYATVYALTSGNFNVVPVRIGSLIAGDVTLNPYLASALAMFLVLIMAVVALISNFISKKYNYKAIK